MSLHHRNRGCGCRPPQVNPLFAESNNVEDARVMKGACVKHARPIRESSSVEEVLGAMTRPSSSVCRPSSSHVGPSSSVLGREDECKRCCCRRYKQRVEQIEDCFERRLRRLKCEKEQALEEAKRCFKCCKRQCDLRGQQNGCCGGGLFF